jgi:hypothetical protein
VKLQRLNVLPKKKLDAYKKHSTLSTLVAGLLLPQLSNQTRSKKMGTDVRTPPFLALYKVCKQLSSGLYVKLSRRYVLPVDPQGLTGMKRDSF